MKLTPCILFDGQAEQALAFYKALLPEARVVDGMRNGGGFIAATLEFQGHRILLLNGPPSTPSIKVSLMLECEAKDVDRLWDALGEGGAPIRCGWITDRYGVTWQIVPHGLRDLIGHPDPARAARAMQAMMTMTKLDIAEIERAADAG